jgi:bHLH-MYC and R2R3-MYB transcription factors N-terminal
MIPGDSQLTICPSAGSQLTSFFLFPQKNLNSLLAQRCAPFNLILQLPSSQEQPGLIKPQHVASGATASSLHIILKAVAPFEQMCPVCGCAAVTSIDLFPIGLHDVDHAVALRKEEAKQKNSECNTNCNATDTSVRSTEDHKFDEEFASTHAELSYLLVARSHSGGSPSIVGGAGSTTMAASSDNEFLRTGRWKTEEIAYVDYIVQAFDRGILPLPEGVKLNEFLCDLLLCKASRLSKKMKNARLSLRSFQRSFDPKDGHLDTELLSSLQEKFLASVSHVPTSLELRFNIAKMWRIHFSNLCVQVGSSLLNAEQWMNSLEAMEKRAAQAESTIRQARRRRMRLALQKDAVASPDGVFYAGKPVRRPAELASAEQPLAKRNRTAANRCASAATSEVKSQNVDQVPPPTVLQCASGPALSTDLCGKMEPQGSLVHEVSRVTLACPHDDSSTVGESASSDSQSLEDEFISEMLDSAIGADYFYGNVSQFSDGAYEYAEGQRGNFHEESSVGSSVTASLSRNSYNSSNLEGIPTLGRTSFANRFRNNCGTFLEEIVTYMESSNVPFQHADLWVPSFPSSNGFAATTTPGELTGTETALRLYHAGHASRTDLDTSLFLRMREYGEYSTAFSFASGVGLPGRVFASGEPSWECHVNQQDPSVFLRAGAARVYGIQTAVGVPLKTPVIGTIVLTLYSVRDIPVDHQLIGRMINDLQRYTPEPKWKLVVDICGDDDRSRASGASAAPSDEKGGDTRSNELRLAEFIGNNMPLDASTGADHGVGNDMLPHCLALRLLLLRSPSKRFPHENELIEILARSFKSYNSSARSSSDVLRLVVKDWELLQSSMPNQPHRGSPPLNLTTTGNSGQYVSHTLDLGLVGTPPSPGVPVKPPLPLTYLSPRNGRKLSLPCANPATEHSVLVVDE